MEVIKRKARSCCSVKTLKKRLPICSWLPVYSGKDLLGDFIAGLTVGLTAIPQAIAYALIAGLPPNYGLYSNCVGCFIYVLLGSSKDIVVGPTAIMSILTFEYARGDPNVAVLLCFTTSVIIILFGLFNLGFLITFVSKPVISGFTSAAAITIASSQLKGLLGIQFSSHGLIETWMLVGKHISETRWQDITLGVCCIVILLSLKKIREFEMFKRNETDSSGQKAFKFFIFLISVGRNAIVVVIATVIAGMLDDNQPFTITGDIKPGLPPFSVPPFTTNNGTVSFTEIMQDVGVGVIILPLISILENIAIASAFAGGKTIDATQEMYALGIANLFASFFQAMPTTGSFSRTAVNATSGVRTTAGGIVTGTLVILALAILTPYFRFIPKSALAGVVICAVIFMIEYHDVMPIWRVRKADEFVLWISFLLCLFWKLEYGIVVGIFVNVIILLFGQATPRIDVNLVTDIPSVPPHVRVVPYMGLVYVNINCLRKRVTKASNAEAKGEYPVIIDCQHFSSIDYSASSGVQSICQEFIKKKQSLFFLSVSSDIKRGMVALSSDINIIESEEELWEILKENESLVDVKTSMLKCIDGSKGDSKPPLIDTESKEEKPGPADKLLV